MIETQASRTALMVAGYRARASEQTNPVCGDRWAAHLAGDVGIELSREFDKGYPDMELWIALRTRYLDEQIRHWTERFHQVVMLGAGLDTRAARLARDDVRFYEVDHPATQAMKREKLGELAGYPVAAATYTPCNFEQQDFLEQLRETGFEVDRPAVVVWEGVVPYLTEEAVRATLKRIADDCHPDTVVLFDYLMKRMGEGIDLPEKDRQVRDLVERVGEPVRFGLNEPVKLLYEQGFRYARVISFNEIALSFTGSYDRARMFRFQHIALASRTVHSIL